MTPQALIDCLNSNWLLNAETIILDTQYSLPTESWLDHFFAEALPNIRKAYRATEYVKNRRDCENFAFLAMSLAGEIHADSSSAETGVAIGVLLYKPDISTERHAINFAIVAHHGEAYLRFYEPQTGKKIILTESEKVSATHAII